MPAGTTVRRATRTFAEGEAAAGTREVSAVDRSLGTICGRRLTVTRGAILHLDDFHPWSHRLDMPVDERAAQQGIRSKLSDNYKGLSRRIRIDLDR